MEDGRLVQLRPDRSTRCREGFSCPKGIAMTEVQNDPDRVLHPLRRAAGRQRSSGSPGSEALDDIAARLPRSSDEHGGDSVGWYFGNPAAFSYSHVLWLQGFIAALGMRHVYSAGSQDVNNRFVASQPAVRRATACRSPTWTAPTSC